MHGKWTVESIRIPSLSPSSAQLQQLESRLRYSKTDKETAEKKQRILMEKDLVEFQGKSTAFEPRIRALKASIAEREKSVAKIQAKKNQIEDGVFTEFCKQIHVANIR